MWPWSRISDLKDEIKNLNDINASLNARIDRFDLAELEFLRELIKDYAVVKPEDSGWYVGYRFYADRTLSQAERELKAKKLYIKVLESELGPEKSKSCQEKFMALVALKCDDDNLKAIGEEHAEG